MAISSESPYAQRAAMISAANNNDGHSPTTEKSNGRTSTCTEPAMAEKMNGLTNGVANEPTGSLSTAAMAPPKSSIDTSGSSANACSIDTAVEFIGEVDTNNVIPTQEVLKSVEDMTVFDKDGKIVPFKHLYSGPNVTRRVLIIFIRHFFCGNCQEYLRTLTDSIASDELLALPTPTFIAIVGHGSPALIPMYASETHCTFPIYADPTKQLYNALGMLRTLNMGPRPEYQRRGVVKGMWESVRQGLSNLKGGKALQGMDWHQVGGEFLFEPVNMATPISSPADEVNRQLGTENLTGNGKLGYADGYVEEKRITWCHRMKNTRDHAELPELREVLGLDGVGVPGRDRKRWTKALGERKGTGLSTVSVRTSSSLTRDGGSSGRQSVSVEREKAAIALDGGSAVGDDQDTKAALRKETQ